MVSMAASADAPNATTRKRIVMVLIATGPLVGAEVIVVVELSGVEVTVLVTGTREVVTT